MASALALLSSRDGFTQIAVPPNQDIVESGHSPKGALWRAAVLPGWGQVYNRQYLKLPFLYAAIGGLTYLVIDVNDEYLLYRRAFLYKSFQELVDSGQLESNPNEGLKSYYDNLANQFGEIPSAPIRERRDNLRRNRDLSVVGIGLVYGLSILDAFISAHLLDFDVGEDLSLSLFPGPLGIETTLYVRF
ncbi:MAG: DUF5683 domain-containing protein [Rhodothermales bacterium]|nr:DUF5683 domain-containing protein [Rhodothermales bacterium]